MKVTLKLFASLLAYLPAECRRTSRVDLELVPGATLQELIDRFRLPPGSCALVLVNGAIVPPGARDGRVLAPDDVVAIWPPVGGG